MIAARLAAALLLATTPLVAQDGTRDPGFGSNGLVRFDFPVAGDPMDAEAHDLLVEPDGRILIAGPLRDLDFQFLDARTGVTRLLPDGTRDDSYGAVGKVRLDFMVDNDVIDGLGLTRIQPAPGGGAYVGSAYLSEGFRGRGYALARLRPGGALEPSFGGGGIVRRVFTDEDMRFADLAVQADGKLLVLGDGADPAFTEQWFVVYRHRTDGSLDPTFGDGGRAVFGLPSGGNFAGGMALQRDGKIVVSGTAYLGTFPDLRLEFAVLRLLPTGDPDPSFGTGGRVTFGFGGSELDVEPGGVAIDEMGRILVVGTHGRDGVLARLLPGGGLDPAFSGGGKRKFQFVSADPDLYDVAVGVALQSDGRILAIGDMFQLVGSDPTQFAVARFRSDGELDSSFSDDGRAVFDLATAEFGGSHGQQLALAHDGRLLAVGYASVGDSDDDFVVLRLRNRLIFADGFQRGDASAWSTIAP
jgi:uncharacterized delta-60 repeat protein